jgi:hypothetical protein
VICNTVAVTASLHVFDIDESRERWLYHQRAIAHKTGDRGHFDRDLLSVICKLASIMRNRWFLLKLDYRF